MKWMYAIVLLFSFLTIYFTYADFRKKAMPARTFIIIAVMEGTVVLLSLIMLMM